MNWFSATGTMALTLLPVVLSPGASFTLALSELLRGARSGPGWVALGTSLGAFTLAAVLGATGLVQVITSRPALVHGLNVLGGSALIWLGLRTLLPARRTSSSPGQTGRSVVGLAYFTVVSNPKALTLYLVIAPKTMPSPNGLSYLVFASVHALLVFGWLLGWGVVLSRWPVVMQSGRVQRFLLYGTALYLMFLGLTTIWRS